MRTRLQRCIQTCTKVSLEPLRRFRKGICAGLGFNSTLAFPHLSNRRFPRMLRRQTGLHKWLLKSPRASQSDTKKSILPTEPAKVLKINRFRPKWTFFDFYFRICCFARIILFFLVTELFWASNLAKNFGIFFRAHRTVASNGPPALSLMFLRASHEAFAGVGRGFRG